MVEGTGQHLSRTADKHCWTPQMSVTIHKVMKQKTYGAFRDTLPFASSRIYKTCRLICFTANEGHNLICRVVFNIYATLGH